MRHLDAAGGGAMAPVKREAERLVDAHWDAIVRVAVALSERGKLSGDEVDALILKCLHAMTEVWRHAHAQDGNGGRACSWTALQRQGHWL